MSHKATTSMKLDPVTHRIGHFNITLYEEPYLGHDLGLISHVC